MLKHIFVPLIVVTSACNNSNEANENNCTVIPEKDVIEIQGTSYAKASGNAVVAVTTDEKQKVTGVAIRYIEILKDGKLTRVAENINASQRPELGPVIKAIEQSTWNATIKCSETSKETLHLQYLVRLSLK